MVKLTMLDGEEMEFTVSLHLLRVLKEKKPEAKEYTKAFYDSMGGITVKDTEEVIYRGAKILYAGYLCSLAKKEELDKAIDYEKFEEILPEDLTEITLASTALISPNRTGDLEKYLKSIPTQKG
ncbi:MAG: hypothetical protein LUD72_12065 [Bacteroidales bacterium]|nr:hypothetical protein [Bacteroidales bacterium]